MATTTATAAAQHVPDLIQSTTAAPVTKPRDMRFIVKLRRRPSITGAITGAATTGSPVTPSPHAPLDAASDLFGASLTESQPLTESHPLSNLSSENDSQRSQATGSDSCDSVLGKRSSSGVDEIDAPLRKRSCLRVPASLPKSDADGVVLRVCFCEDLVAVRTLDPDHKQEAARLSWYSEPGWDPSHASREIEDDDDDCDESHPPPSEALSRIEAEMLAADLEYEVRREAAAAAYAAEHADSDDADPDSESDDDSTSSGVSSATDDESNSDAAGSAASPLFATLSPPGSALSPVHTLPDGDAVRSSPVHSLALPVHALPSAHAHGHVHDDMMTTEAFVEWAACTMHDDATDLPPADLHCGLPPPDECRTSVQGEVSDTRLDLPPCSP